MEICSAGRFLLHNPIPKESKMRTLKRTFTFKKNGQTGQVTKSTYKNTETGRKIYVIYFEPYDRRTEPEPIPDETAASFTEVSPAAAAVYIRTIPAEHRTEPAVEILAAVNAREKEEKWNVIFREMEELGLDKPDEAQR